ncbi:NAD-dependent epimerase/dehydratase family protein [Mucilaginibacter sp. Bleaf8]|uniref:NAD-dependent epimerase/dehydratase family protein n=1 Tax=Mucilaginibacter sp. Bleaf8 TaxID=2834430 RepID=UPI001BCCE08D|nr:NAD-dependent epimerase/dehydratase family protein [Mucilaginibacter sp. Bleaf8]MBS7563838.1 NAD-dependent epimerase/dehydratase family protein [Mucilaginibacter sp. Bleaf8]
MIKILITGGAGNVAGALACHLVQNEIYHVVVADNLITGCMHNLPQGYDNFTFIKCDVNNYDDLAAVMLAFRFDYVFHYAALVGVKRTLNSPISVLQDIEGIKNILNLSKNTGVKRVFYSSSSEVYGEPVEFPQNERTTPLNSRLPYAIVKNVGEAFFKSYHKEYGLDFTIFRFFNTYGPKQSTDFVVSKFIDLALKNQDITIYGNGLQTRTFCYIDDNIDTTAKIFEESLYLNEVVNIGNAVEVSVLDLAKKVIQITDSSSTIIHLDPLKEGDMTRRQPDNSRMLQVLQRELVSIEEGIQKILETKYKVAPQTI